MRREFRSPACRYALPRGRNATSRKVTSRSSPSRASSTWFGTITRPETSAGRIYPVPSRLHLANHRGDVYSLVYVVIILPPPPPHRIRQLVSGHVKSVTARSVRENAFSPRRVFSFIARARFPNVSLHSPSLAPGEAYFTAGN